MTDYDNTNSFVLFKNDKEGNEKRPDYTGTITLENGEEKRLAAWIREGKSGQKFMSGKISEPLEKKAAVESDGDFSDDIPF